jgi:hypothetical protein
MSSSSTIGYLQPIPSSLPLEDIYLQRFLQAIVVGITGMDGRWIFQRVQPDGEPANIPNFGVDWAAVGEMNRSRDTFPFVSENSVSRLEVLTVLCSFYGPNAKKNAEILVMGFGLAQNREFMTTQGYAFVSCDDSITTMDMHHERWVPRVDVQFHLRRAVTYLYNILNLLGSTLSINADGNSVNITVPPQDAPLFVWGPLGSFTGGWGTGNWTQG